MFELARIFLPVDFSNGSRTALAFARRFAKPTDAQIEAVHVASPIPRSVRGVLFPYAGLGSDEVALAAELRESTSKALSGFLRLKRDKADKKAPSLEVCYEGHDVAVADTLSAALASSEAGLVIAGSSGESGPAPGCIGSTIERLIAASTRPVLLVRDVGGNQAIKRVAVALDLSTESAAVYSAGLQLALTQGAALDIVVVVPFTPSKDVHGVVTGALKTDVDGLKKRGQRELKNVLTRLREETKVDFPYVGARAELEEEVALLVGDPAAELARYLGEREIQVVVVGRRGGGATRLPLRLGRTARAVAATAPAHVMVVP